MKFKKQIQWYSAFATSYLLTHSIANADAVYVDIEPDITLDNGGAALKAQDFLTIVAAAL